MLKNRDFTYEKKAAQIIKDVQYLTIATVSPEGKPWNTPVYAAFDSDLNFYWTSDKSSVHSTNIRHSSEVFMAIYDTTVKRGPSPAAPAVYFEAQAYELDKREEITVARKLTQARLGEEADDADSFMGRASQRVYRAVVDRGWTNESEKFPDGWHNFRVEVNLRRLRGML